MHVYQHGRLANATLYAQPAVDFPDVSEWREPTGKPKLFEVKFKQGKAEVSEELGRYLLDKGLVKTSPLILPPEPHDNAKRIPTVY